MLIGEKTRRLFYDLVKVFIFQILCFKSQPQVSFPPFWVSRKKNCLLLFSERRRRRRSQLRSRLCRGKNKTRELEFQIYRPKLIILHQTSLAFAFAGQLVTIVSFLILGMSLRLLNKLFGGGGGSCNSRRKSGDIGHNGQVVRHLFRCNDTKAQLSFCGLLCGSSFDDWTSTRFSGVQLGYLFSYLSVLWKRI